MRRQFAAALVILALAGSSAHAQEGVAAAGATVIGGSGLPAQLFDFTKAPSPAYAPYVPPIAIPGTNPPPSVPSVPSAPPTDPFAQPTEAGGQASRSFNENFDGDMTPIYYRQTITTYHTETRITGYSQQVTGFTQQVVVNNGVPTVTNVPIYSNVPVYGQVQVPTRQTALVPLAGRYNGVSVVDWNSPTPRDQVFLGYNFYSNVGASLNQGLGGSDLYRQMGGFEKVIGTNASIGVRLPFIQQYGPAGLSSQQVGDLTVILKYAAYYDRQTGNVLSGGLAVTAPTGGGSTVFLDGSNAPHSWLLQPWGGFVYNVANRGYVQGITNIIAPTDSRDPTLWGNSLGVGYWLYRATGGNPLLTAITPVAEVHVRTPLNHSDPNGAIFFMNQVNITTGINFRFNRAIFSGAVVVPLVGPQPFDIEAIGYVSYWF